MGVRIIPILQMPNRIQFIKTNQRGVSKNRGQEKMATLNSKSFQILVVYAMDIRVARGAHNRRIGDPPSFGFQLGLNMGKGDFHFHLWDSYIHCIYSKDLK